MPDRQLDRGTRAGGNAKHDCFGNVQLREQRRMSIGLRRWRGIRRNRCTEIAETRRCDDLKPIAYEVGGDGETLLVAAARAMYRQERHASAPPVAYSIGPTAVLRLERPAWRHVARDQAPRGSARRLDLPFLPPRRTLSPGNVQFASWHRTPGGEEKPVTLIWLNRSPIAVARPDEREHH